MESLHSFIEHLRKVHFSLLLAVFALSVASSLNPSFELERAGEEARTVSELNSAFRRDRLRQVAEQLELRLPPAAISLHQARKGLWWKAGDMYHLLLENEMPAPRPRLWVPLNNVAFPPSYLPPAGLTADPSGRTLRQFKEAWKFFRNGQDAFFVLKYRPTNSWFRHSQDIPHSDDQVLLENDEIVNSLPPGMIPDFHRGFSTMISVEALHEHGAYAAVLTMTGGAGSDVRAKLGREAVVPLETERFPIDLLPAVLRDAGMSENDVTIYDRPFEVVFRDLNRFAAGLESLRIDETTEYFGKLKESRGETVEIFGAKLPSQLVSIWGVLIIIVLQLYLLLHIRRLRWLGVTPDTRRGDVAWIGLYSDSFSRGVTAVSLALAPLASMILVWRNRDQFNILGNLVLVALVLVALVLAAETWRILSSVVRTDGSNGAKAPGAGSP